MKWAISNPVEIEQYPWSVQIKYPYVGSFKKNNDSEKSQVKIELDELSCLNGFNPPKMKKFNIVQKMKFSAARSRPVPL